jgi:hypothetical protein
VISIAVVEGAANHADRVVVGFLRPLVRVRDLGELGVSDLFEYPWAHLRTPDLREEFAITPGRHEGQVFLCNPRITSDEEFIKDLVARAPFPCCRHILDKAIVRKLLREDEGAGVDALLDLLELLARAFKICFCRAALQCWTVANAVELEIELDTIATEGAHATMDGFAAHCAFPKIPRSS